METAVVKHGRRLLDGTQKHDKSAHAHTMHGVASGGYVLDMCVLGSLFDGVAG